jgi:hypothetical protein
MNVIAKFKVESVRMFTDNRFEVEMRPVTSGAENATWSKYTPSGLIQMMVTNPDVVGQFVPGENVYVSFTNDKDV